MATVASAQDRHSQIQIAVEPGDIFDARRFTLANAIQECGAKIIGESIWNKYRRWPVYSKFFDNMGPIQHHMHQSQEHAKLVGQEGKPESYYFPPQHNTVTNNFPYTFMGLEPGTTPETWLGMVNRSGTASRTRLALHLRAPMGIGRVCYVPVSP